MKNTVRKNKQQGFTLIELMIALVLSAFLLAGIIQIFLGSKQSYRMQENLSRMQENGRFAMEFISRDVRMLGYQGCSATAAVNNTDPKNPNPNPVPITLPAGSVLEITANDNVADDWDAIACGGSDECIAGTDSISLQFGGYCANLKGNVDPVNANIQINAPNSCDINQYDVLLLSDCVAADIFIATSASSGALTQTIAHATNQNTSNNLSKTYGLDAKLFKLNSVTYFIRTGAGGQPALWKMDNTKDVSTTNPLELIEGVEDMQILYGEDTDVAADGTPNYYVDSGSVVNMGRVVSIRMRLLLTSADNVTSQPIDYIYNDDGVTTTTPTDRRLRRVFSSTIALRNRL